MTTITAILLAVLAAVGTAVASYMRGVRSGRNSVIADRSRKDAELRTEFDRIDSRAPDLDDAIDGLRKRSSGDGRPASK